MVTIKTGPGGSIRMSTPNLIMKIRGTPELIRKAYWTGAKEVARSYRDILQGGLRSGNLGLPGIKPDTIKTRLFGKTGGTSFPARARRTGTNPLVSSGTTVGAIRVKIRGTDYIDVNFKEGAMTAYSHEPVGNIAEMQEDGFKRKVTYTKKMLAFLHIMFRKAGKRSPKKENLGRASVGMSYTSNVVSRPAWEVARKKTTPIIRPTMDRHLSIALSNAGLTSR